MERRQKIGLGVTAVLALGAAAVASPLLAFHERNQLRRVVELGLRDPASASYTNDSIHRTEHGVYYCGFINAKNAFGGYTGFRRFIASGQEVTFEPHPGEISTLSADQMKQELRFLDFYANNCPPDEPLASAE